MDTTLRFEEKEMKTNQRNTNNATRLVSYSNGLPVNDFRYLRETLYRKENGEYFLHGQGDALTAYHRICDDGTFCKGECFIPFSKWRVQNWMQNHLSMDDFDFFEHGCIRGE